MPFAYLKDPLFLVCFAVYWIHRFFADHGLSTPLLCGYLNDLICIPFWVPIMLWALRKLKLRRHDRPPEGAEIVIPLLVWTAVFEVFIPYHREWQVPTVADPYDVLAYSVGALLAVLFWKWHYRQRQPIAESPVGN